jgi:hypothetical protein
MRRGRRLVSRGSMIILLFLPMIALGHYFAFPEETRCILIDVTDFKKTDNLYYKTGVPLSTIFSIRNLIAQAEKRDSEFLGSLACKPSFIYCDNETDYALYGNKSGSPACTHTKLGAYIVLSRNGLNADVIAHEILHAELYQRLGFFKYQFAIPVWFNEGLAMQTDYRAEFSEDSLKKFSDGFRYLPELKDLRTSSQFYSGIERDILLNFSAARYEIKRWYTKDKLTHLITALTHGTKFVDAYR